MTSFTRRQVLELLDLDESFLLALEEESIAAPEQSEPEPVYSDWTLERIRVARILVQDLDVNLPGAAVILRMREELAELRRRVAALVSELEHQRRG